MASGGKMPEYTMLTPLPPDDLEQLMGVPMALPYQLMAPPHYPFAAAPDHRHYSDSDSPPGRRGGSPDDDERIEDDDDDDDDDRVTVGDDEGDGEAFFDGRLAGPFAPQCKIPLPTPFSPYEYWLEPSFIRRRNERERQRVRNVNDGFERLKGHLPLGGKDKDKRLSKVEILRMAIRYIGNLQDVLAGNGLLEDFKENRGHPHSESE